MGASVIVPLVVQWQGEDTYELKEVNTDDDTDEVKMGKEKDVYTFFIQFVTKFDAFSTENDREKQYYQHDCLISEHHVFLPEIPPEA